MMLSINHYAHEVAPLVESDPPEIDDDGDVSEASISLFPLGKYGVTGAHFILTIDEADQLARLLWHMVSDARQGIYHPT